MTRVQAVPIKKQSDAQPGSVSFYLAMSHPRGGKPFKQSPGYEQLRQISYASQQQVAEGSAIRLKELFE